jgi:hypothetical protein
MKNNDNQKFIDSLHAMRMTEHERSLMQERLYNHIHAHDESIVVSPYSSMVRNLRRGLAFGLGTLILLGSISQTASAGALPGQFLYPVKIMYEELEATTKTTPEKRIDHEIKRTQKRIEEAANLAQSSTLSEEKQERIATNIKKHTEKLKREINEVKEQNPVMALELNNQFKKTIKENSEILKNIEETEHLENEKESETEPKQPELSSEESETVVEDSEPTVPPLPEINELDIALIEEPKEGIQEKRESQKIIDTLEAEVKEAEQVTQEVNEKIVRDLVEPSTLSKETQEEETEELSKDENVTTEQGLQ